jgi:hypothetical protein
VFHYEPLGEGERHGEDMLGHRLGVGSGVGRQRRFRREVGERYVVRAGGYQLDESYPAYHIPFIGSELL